MSLDSDCPPPVPLRRVRKKLVLTGTKRNAPDRPPPPLPAKPSNPPPRPPAPPCNPLPSLITKSESIGSYDKVHKQLLTPEYSLPDVTKVSKSLPPPRIPSRQGSFNAKEWKQIINTQLDPKEWAMLRSKEEEEVLEVSHDRAEEIYSIRSTPSPLPFSSCPWDAYQLEIDSYERNTSSLGTIDSDVRDATFFSDNRVMITLNDSLPVLEALEAPKEGCKVEMESSDRCSEHSSKVHIQIIRDKNHINQGGEKHIAKLSELDGGTEISEGQLILPRLRRNLSEETDEFFSLSEDSLEREKECDDRKEEKDFKAPAGKIFQEPTSSDNSLLEDAKEAASCDCLERDETITQGVKTSTLLSSIPTKPDQIVLEKAQSPTVELLNESQTNDIAVAVADEVNEEGVTTQTLLCGISAKPFRVVEEKADSPTVEHPDRNNTNEINVRVVGEVMEQIVEAKSISLNIPTKPYQVVEKVDSPTVEHSDLKGTNEIASAVVDGLRKDVATVPSLLRVVHPKPFPVVDNAESITVQKPNGNRSNEIAIAVANEVNEENSIIGYDVEGFETLKFLRGTCQEACEEEHDFNGTLDVQLTKTAEVKKDTVEIKSTDLKLPKPSFSEELSSSVGIFTEDSADRNVLAGGFDNLIKTINKRNEPTIVNIVHKPSTPIVATNTIRKVFQTKADSSLKQKNNYGDFLEELSSVLKNVKKGNTDDKGGDILLNKSTLNNGSSGFHNKEKTEPARICKLKTAKVCEAEDVDKEKDDKVKRPIPAESDCPKVKLGRSTNLMGPKPYHIFLESYSLRQEQQKKERLVEKHDMSLKFSMVSNNLIGDNCNLTAAIEEPSPPVCTAESREEQIEIDIITTESSENKSLVDINRSISCTEKSLCNSKETIPHSLDEDHVIHCSPQDNNRTYQFSESGVKHLQGNLMLSLPASQSMPTSQEVSGAQEEENIKNGIENNTPVVNETVKLVKETNAVVDEIEVRSSIEVTDVDLENENLEHDSKKIIDAVTYIGDATEGVITEGMQIETVGVCSEERVNIFEPEETSQGFQYVKEITETPILTSFVDISSVEKIGDRAAPSSSLMRLSPVADLEGIIVDEHVHEKLTVEKDFTESIPSEINCIVPTVTITPCLKSQWHSQVVTTASPEAGDELLDASDLWLKKMYQKELNDMPPCEEVWSNPQTKKKVRFLDSVEQIPNNGYDSDIEDNSDDDGDDEVSSKSPQSNEIVIFQRKVDCNAYDLAAETCHKNTTPLQGKMLKPPTKDDSPHWKPEFLLQI